jgi:hypothetical protein
MPKFVIERDMPQSGKLTPRQLQEASQESAAAMREMGAIHLIIAVAMAVALSSTALAQPSVPQDLQAPSGNSLYLTAQASGTQNYICLPSASGFSWTFFSPQATLFTTFKFFGRDIRQQIVTHFLSPNPAEGGTPRATWQGSVDTSAVWAKLFKSSTDSNFVVPGAIPWFLLGVVGSRRGPEGGGVFTDTTYIQRLNTSGGVAPSAGCSTSANVGATALAPYTADYLFYRQTPKY